MSRLYWLAALTLVLLAALACGGGGDDDASSSTTITVQPNLAQRRAGLSEAETLELFQAIMGRRGEYIDGSAEATINDNSTLTVEYSGIEDDVAAILFARSANLTVAGPRRSGDDIVCLDSAGHETAVPVESITYGQVGARFIPRCELPDSTFGDIAWQDVEVPNRGRLQNLDIEKVFLQTEAGPTIIVDFDEEGSLKLSYISAQFIGLPLAIFVDGELLAGPKVSSSIEDGRLVIAGLSLREARIMRAQFRAGAIPSPFIVQIND